MVMFLLPNTTLVSPEDWEADMERREWVDLDEREGAAEGILDLARRAETMRREGGDCLSGRVMTNGMKETVF